MSENTTIEWADHTFNPWEGCQKVGAGCDHCYAETRNARFGGGVAINWGPNAVRRRTSVANWRKPLAWNAAHANFLEVHGRRQRVFCASLADVFDNAVDASWRVDLMRLIAQTPNLDWLLLTKRIGNVQLMLDEAIKELSDGLTRWEDAPWPNVWLGATITGQAEADRDIPKLLQVPAEKRFLSMEPLLGHVNLHRILSITGRRDFVEPLNSEATSGSQSSCLSNSSNLPAIDWVIVGGESGTGARPMHPDWVRSLRDQCVSAGVQFLFKQWGEWIETHGDPGGDLGRDMRRGIVRIVKSVSEQDGHFRFEDVFMSNVGKKAAGRILDGVIWDEAPLLKLEHRAWPT